MANSTDTNLLIFQLILNILNVLLHSLGLYLLIHLYKNGMDNSRHLCMISLSSSECLYNSLIIISVIVKKMNCQKAIHILENLRYGMMLIYYFTIIYLTLDRLMDVLLNLKYTLYWNEIKTTRLLLGTWVVGSMVGIVGATVNAATGIVVHDSTYLKYFSIVTDLSFILLAIITYVYIFKKYKQSRITPTNRQTISNVLFCVTSRRRLRTLHVFRKSRFYIPLLIIVTFVIFVVIPDLLYLLLWHIVTRPLLVSGNLIVKRVCRIGYAISDLVDAWIYIFIQDSVRNVICKYLRIRRGRN